MQPRHQHALPKQLTIEIISGVDDGTLFRLELQGSSLTATLGRDQENDVSLPNDACVSREHAVLTWTTQGWRLEDCQSRNGTFIEADDLFAPDVSITTFHPVLIGMPFRIGKTWIIVRNYA